MEISCERNPCGQREGDSSEQQEGISPPLLTVNLIPYRPLLGAVVDLTLNFVLKTSISFKIDEFGTLMVVMGECTYTPAKISLPSMNRSGPISQQSGTPRGAGIPNFSPIPMFGREQTMVKKR